MRILYTGYGSSQFGRELKNQNNDLDIFFATKNDCNLLDRESIDRFCDKQKHFDCIITGANTTPGFKLTQFNTDSLTIPVNHLYLVSKLKNKPEFFINLTTGLLEYDDHFLYRAQKTFAEDLYKRYFFLNKDTRMINFHPNHISDDSIRPKSTKIFIELLTNIHTYTEYDYVAVPNQDTEKPINTRY